jgi:hypothetical protein
MGMNTKGRGDVDETSTWAKHKQRLCVPCRANCCTMPVEVMFDDMVRMDLLSVFDADVPMKKLANQLKKEGLVEHFNSKIRFLHSYGLPMEIVFISTK